MFRKTEEDQIEEEAEGRLWLDDAEPILGSLYAVRGWLPRQGLATLYGPPGAGKTWFALDLAAHCAAGRDWHGARVRGGLVVYVAFEGLAGMENRLVPLRRSLGDTPLVVLKGGLDLCDPSSVRALLDAIPALETKAGVPVAQVWIDTLARAMSGRDENSSEGMVFAMRAQLESGHAA